MGNPSVQHVITYVDGFNLYFGLKTAHDKRYYWLDLMALSRRLLRPSQELQRVCYFTSRIRDNHHNQDDRLRQNTYLEALPTRVCAYSTATASKSTASAINVAQAGSATRKR